MSHSDSEVNRPKRDFKKLHVEFKAKNSTGSMNARNLLRKIKALKDSRLLMRAVGCNNTEIVQKRLASGVSPNTADAQGRSVLHVAASKGYIDIVKVLLEHGADPNQKDKLCNTPLHLAVCTHNLSIVSLLLKAGADVRKLDVYGKSPLELAHSKLRLLQRSWREGSIEIIQIRAELHLIVDIMIRVLEQRQSPQETSVDELQLMKLSLNSNAPDTVDDQMSKLLSELEGIKIS